VAPGTYTINVTNSEGCISEGTSVLVEAHIGTENHSPIAVNDSVLTLMNTLSLINVLINDSDPDGNILTVSICGQPLHGSIVLNEDQTFTYYPATGYTGRDEFCYTICDNGTPSLCSSANVIITIVPDEPRPEITIFNTFTPNGDGKNDTWYIEGIKSYSDNEVKIFNRWGDEVWSAENYNNESVVWDGSNKNGEKLPDATYFYIVKLRNMDKVFSGWVMIHK
jgi:gliding motility-associated-like protein